MFFVAQIVHHGPDDGEQSCWKIEKRKSETVEIENKKPKEKTAIQRKTQKRNRKVGGVGVSIKRIAKRVCGISKGGLNCKTT